MTKIQWTNETWNPVTGCTKVSQGCKHCYAERDFPRVYAKTGRKFVDIALHPERLEKPLRWTKPRMIFVNSMSDLFHEDVPDEFIDQVFAVMAMARSHTFQVLTKRPDRMRRWVERMESGENDTGANALGRLWDAMTTCVAPMPGWVEVAFDCAENVIGDVWPLPNVWIGVSVEDQATADERIPLLLETPAALRWVSYEPALGPVDFEDIVVRSEAHLEWHFSALECDVDTEDDEPFNGATLDWIVVGGESGPGARPFDIEWARSTVEQCKAAGVACFVKQLGAKPFERQPSLDKGFAGRDLLDVMNRPRPPQMNGWGRITTATETFYQRHLDLNDRKGGDMEEWPADLRVREWPEARS